MSKRFHNKGITFLLIMLIVCVFTIGSTPEEASAAVKKPAKVTLTKVTANSQSAITITWKKAKNAKGYQIFQNGKSIKKVKASTLTFKKTGLKAGTKYSYKVRAYTTYKQKQWYNKKTGKWQQKKPKKKYRGKSRKVTKYKYGAFSTEKSATTKAAKPAVITTDKSLTAGTKPSTINMAEKVYVTFAMPTKGSLAFTSNDSSVVSVTAQNSTTACLTARGEAGSATITATFTPASGYACTGSKKVQFTVENTVFPVDADGSYEVVADWQNYDYAKEPTTFGGYFREFTSALYELPNGAVIKVNAENMYRDPVEMASHGYLTGWGMGTVISSTNEDVVYIDNSAAAKGIVFAGAGESDLTLYSGKVIHVIAD